MWYTESTNYIPNYTYIPIIQFFEQKRKYFGEFYRETEENFMQPTRFHMPVELIYEDGALQKVGTYAKGYGRRCLIMTSAGAAQKSRALADAMDSLKAAGVEATVFPLITANPSVLSCFAAQDAAGAAGADSILAIGGGSVMDAAKAAAWMATNYVPSPRTLFDGELKREPLPLMLCGTTAGTGSEVSAVAVITDTDGKKRSIKNVNCFAKVVFADPQYTATMPRGVTVSTALDALCHAVEGYLSPACDVISTLFAERALPLLTAGLTALCDNDLPTDEQRRMLFEGALYAGMVLNSCGTAFPHPMGYVLTEDHGIPHGQACAVFLPALLDRAATYTPARAEALFALCGGEETLRRVSETLVDVDVTMTEEQLAACAKRFADLPHYARVPGGFSGDDAVALCRKLFAK